MKAGHRKELQTNVLADRMGKLLAGGKESPKVIWVLLILVLAVGVAYWWWTGNTADRLSTQWMNYWDSRDHAARVDGSFFLSPEEVVKQLNEIADDFEGTPAERAAKLTEADALYEKGYQTLFRRPAEAREYFEKASVLYLQLSKNAGGSKDVAVRAVMGAAKCQESLGDLEQARRYYQQAVERFGSVLVAHDGTPHPLVQEAEKRKALLESKEAIGFYQGTMPEERWPQRLPKVTMSRPTVPPPPPEEAFPPPSSPLPEASPAPTTPPTKPEAPPPSPSESDPAKRDGTANKPETKPDR